MIKVNIFRRIEIELTVNSFLFALTLCMKFQHETRNGNFKENSIL